MRRVEVKSRRRIFDDFFKIEEAELRFERYDGRMSPTVRRLKFERGDSVAAIVIDRDKRCLYLTEQFKYPTLENGDGWIIEVVAGTREDNETAEDTLRREIEEEIGFAVEHAEPIAAFYVSPGGTSERIFLFCAIVSGKSRRSAGGGVAAENEDIKVIEWPVSELLAKLDAKQLEDAKTIIAAYWIRDNYKRLIVGWGKPMKETCFVIMPFGKKEDIDGVIINFDEVYQDLIEPVITDLQMTAVRCDQVAEAGWIHKNMIRHIHDAEACVVDLTTLNPNVFYELGIRHALRRQVTVLLRRKGVRLPFNIQGLRTIEYDLGYRGVTHAKEEIRTFLSNGLAQRKNDSLVYDILPDLRIPASDRPIKAKQKILYEITKCKNRKIGLITGNIRHIDGIDIWVNSENTNMQMARFFDRSVCSIIRYLGARRDDAGLVVEDLIADQLNAIVKQKTVPPGTVICTSPGELARSHGVVAIMHVAAVTGQLGSGYCPVADLGECVHNVLYKVDQTEGLRETPRSILFPLLGTGTAQGSPEELVPPQIGAAVAYLEDRASTAIDTVWFLVYTTKHLEICTNILAEMSSQCRPLADVA